MSKIRAGIMGAAGYTGGELIRLLVNHPEAEIAFAHSKSQAGRKLASVHAGLDGDTDLVFSESANEPADVVFLCMGHGESKALLEKTSFPEGTKIVDLSQDFRITGNHDFVYGLPELNREKIRSARNIANPGCFATAVQLALLPLAKEGWLKSEIFVTATTGSTGAGQSLSETSHFSWRDSNLSVYKALTHQHMAEIRQSVTGLLSDFGNDISMIPQRGPFTRGILASLVLRCDEPIEKIRESFGHYYESHPFVHVAASAPDLKQVVNTNKCLVFPEKAGDRLIITSVIDNLLKGASGQAVQNMNLLFGLGEMSGLRLKASAF
jgi:N-acetyl-gamma-glutamyl-phosphate reductase